MVLSSWQLYPMPFVRWSFLLWLVRTQNIPIPTGALEIVQPNGLQWFYFLCLVVSSHACTGVISRRLKGTLLQTSGVFSLQLSPLWYSVPWLPAALASLNLVLWLFKFSNTTGLCLGPLLTLRCSLKTPPSNKLGQLGGAPHLFLFSLW